MKQVIRYLYEYENGNRVRNIGFIKMEKQTDKCMIQIHGKGLDFGTEKRMDVYVFYLKNGACIKVPQGMMEDNALVINWVLKFEAEDVGGAEAFEAVAGIVLQNAQGRKYAAMWTDTPVDIEHMKDSCEEDVESEEEEQEAAEAVGEAEYRQMQKPSKEEQNEEHNPVKPREQDCPSASGDYQKERDSEATDGRARETLSEYVEKLVEKQEVQAVPEEEVDAYILPNTRTYEKIQRQDISRFPRREWKLANNSFLLHGFYNYHHLLYIEEDGNRWIGVPGIYHEKERAAARAFGFPQFHRITDADIELSREEKNTYDDFGYWCRQIDGR